MTRQHEADAPSLGPMAVGVLAPPWPIPTDRYGGLEAVVDGLCRGLQSAGHDVRLWAAMDATCSVKTAGIFRFEEMLTGWALPKEVHHTLAGYQWMLDSGVAVVHDHTLIGPLVAKHFPLPVVTTCHMPFTRDDVRTLYHRVSDDVAVVAVSQAQARDAEGVRVAAVVHHGTDVDATPVGDGRGDSKGPYVAFLGRMSPEKGVHLAVAGCRAAGKRLLIAARMEEPIEYRYFSECVEPHLGDGIEYIGEVTTDEKLRLLGGAEVVVNPVNWDEPFGLVMIEALACGTPVVALKRGSVEEIVENGLTGIVCDTPAEMPAAIRSAPDLDRSACRLAAEERFSISRMAQEYASIYTTVRTQLGCGDRAPA